MAYKLKASHKTVEYWNISNALCKYGIASDSNLSLLEIEYIDAENLTCSWLLKVTFHNRQKVGLSTIAGSIL